MKQATRSDIAILLLVLSLIVIRSCKGSPETGSQVDSPLEGSEEISSPEILITRAQFESAGMELGDPTPHLFQQSVTANGYVVPSPQGWARISTPLPGRVKEIFVTPGEKVKKGQRLFTMESNEIIALQQEYAESFHQLKAVQASYERQKVLSEGQASSQREFIEAESDYRSLQAKVAGLKAQLGLLSIDAEEVEKGVIGAAATMRASISGHVTHMELVTGSFAGNNEPVVELIDMDRLQVVLHIFEKDLSKLEPGQVVHFYDPNNPGSIGTAKLIGIGRSIDPETRTVECRANIVSGQKGLVSGLFVETRIITFEREAPAVPEEAIVNEGGVHFVLARKSESEQGIVFQKVPVEIGTVQDHFAEILHPNLTQVLLSGGYQLETGE